MKNYLIIIVLSSFFSCTNSGDDYVGKWTKYASIRYIKISKAGNGYLVSEYAGNNEWVYKTHCEFVDGCFQVEYDGNVHKLVCDNGSGDLISIRSGLTFNKK